MIAKLLALGAALVLSGAVAAQSQSYAGYSDGTLAEIPPPTSAGQAFCLTDPNIVFAFTATRSGPAQIDESGGTAQVNLDYELVAYCAAAPASRLGINGLLGGTAVLGSDYTFKSPPKGAFTSLNQFDSGQSASVILEFEVVDDATLEPTETIAIDDANVARLTTTGTQQFDAAGSTPDFTVSILDNDGAPPPGADLAVAQTDTAGDPLVVGDTFQISVSATNNGPASATFLLADDFATQLTLVDTDCNNAVTAPNQVSHSLTLAAGASGGCTLDVRVNAPGTITNTVRIMGSSVPDPDPSNDSVSATLGTAVANMPPLVSNGMASAMNGQPVTIDLLPRARDPEGRPLVFTLQSAPPPAQGTAEVSGHFATFTPAPDFMGTVPLSIRVTDDAANSATFIIEVSVSFDAVNQPPVATDGAASTTGVLPVTIALQPLAMDLENDALSFAIAAPPPAAQGTAVLIGSDLRFTPARGFEGNAAIGVSVSDPTHPPVPFTVTVTVTNNPANRPPTGMDGSGQSSGGAEASIELAPLFTDPDGDALAFAIATQPANGTARIAGTTAFYLPNANFEGTDTFTVRATDTAGNATTIAIVVAVDANLDPGETADDLNDALDAVGGGSEVAQATVAAVSLACGEAGSGSNALATCNALVDAADANDGAAVEDALENLAAEEVSAQSNVATAIMSQQKANVAARMAAVRGGSSGFDLAGLSMFAGNGALSLGMFGSNLDAGQDGNGGAIDGLRPSPWGVFVNGSIGGGNRDGGGTESGFDFDNYGVSAGVDYRLNDRSFIGVALGYSASEVDLDDDSGELDTDGLGLTAYYSWYGANGWYADGSLGYFRNDYEQLRLIDLTSIGLGTDRALSETEASQFVATFGIGYEFSRNGWLLTPEFRIEYAGTDIDGFDETGNNDSGFLLSFPEQSFESLQYSGALQVARAFSTAGGVVQPFVRLDWYYESDNDGFTIVPRLRSDPTQPFAQILIDDPDRNFGSVSGGLSWVRPGGTQFYLSLYRTFAYDDLEQWVLRGGLRWEF